MQQMQAIYDIFHDAFSQLSDSELNQLTMEPFESLKEDIRNGHTI